MPIKKPSRYDHERQDWFAFDQIPNCKEKIEICPKGYQGHRTYWLNVKEWKRDNDGLWFQVVIKIVHAHFVANRDTGRHVEDLIGTKWIHERYTVLSRRLDYAKIPEWLKVENEI